MAKVGEYIASPAGKVLSAVGQLAGAAWDAMGNVPGLQSIAEGAGRTDGDGNRLSTGEAVGRIAVGGFELAGSLEGMSSLAKFNPNRAGHIFRDAENHLPRSTSASSQGRFARLFESVASNPANRNDGILSPGALNAGKQGFTQQFRRGQVWVETMGGEIMNAGVNR